MAKRITRWEPDTHPGVIVDIEWDTDTPEAEPIFKRFGNKNDVYETLNDVPTLVSSGGAIQKPAGARFSALTDAQVYATMVGENKAKNIGMEEIITLLPEDEKTSVLDSNGGTQVVPVPKISYTIASDGIVEFSLANLKTQTTKTSISTKTKTSGIRVV